MSQAPKSEEKLRPIEYLYVAIFNVLFFGIPIYLVWSIAPNSIRYPIYYSLRYSIPKKHVLVDKYPADCDWWHAPIGEKGCHYEKYISIEPDEGRPVPYVRVVWVKITD